jgi:streptogramin lyase
MAVGPGGRVWVSVTGSDKLVWFDATSPSPSVHDVSTGAGCGPVGIVSGGDGRIYFSQPSDGVLCGVNQIGYVKDSSTQVRVEARPPRSWSGRSSTSPPLA